MSATSLEGERPLSTAPAPFRAVSVRFLAVIAGLLALANVVPLPDRFGLAALWLRLDLVTLVAIGILLLLAAARPATLNVGSGSFPERFAAVRGIAWLLPGAALLVAWAGTQLVFGATPVSYDEVQAVFDSRILASGHLAAPLPEAFRPFVRQLEPFFFLRIPGDSAWVSAYWPGNAAIRAGFERLVGEDLASPALLAVGLWATWGVSLKLWPGRRDTALVAVLLLATSAQVLVLAMTPYAMTAHFALGMVWLRLFLANRPWAHAGALLVGAVAIGLHQVAFHPLFVGPFLLLLLVQRRWGWVVFYGVGYAAIGIAWLAYPGWLAATASGTPIPGGLLDLLFPNPGAGSAGPDLTGRSAVLVLAATNALRAIAWLNPALILLFAVGVPVAIRGRAVERALLASVLLTVIAAGLVAMPYQGHGWGYRYMHGIVGSVALVAALAWNRLREDGRLAAWSQPLMVLTAGSLAVLLPLCAMQARDFTRPIRTALDMIGNSRAGVVLIDDRGIAFGIDLVRNRPDLSNRPVVMGANGLDEARIEGLCRQGPVGLFDFESGRRAGLMVGTAQPEDAARALSLSRIEARCGLRRL